MKDSHVTSRRAVGSATRGVDRGVVVAPEWRAAQIGASVLEDGGNAVEAAIATAAALSVTYPHMTGIGGDAFWLVCPPEGTPRAVMGCGRAGEHFTVERFSGLRTVPTRGPDAAITTAGAVASWDRALQAGGGGSLGWPRLMRDAAELAADCSLAPSLKKTIAEKKRELSDAPGWTEVFGDPGESLRRPGFAETLGLIGEHGPRSFYEGELGRRIREDFGRVGISLTKSDLVGCDATLEAPLTLDLDDCRLFNTPPPTQGLASLLILAITERLAAKGPEAEDAYLRWTHGIVEATKRAFSVRDAEIADPDAMDIDCQSLLDDPKYLDALASAVSFEQAKPWPEAEPPSDTTWLGVIDRDGMQASMIQSLYFEFGSGVVLPETGIVWQNRGAAFRLDSGRRRLAPRRRPFHTLNPAIAHFRDGRSLVYGTMGGEGQPQTQAAVFLRHARLGWSLERAIDAPRWLLGRTWGDDTSALRMEPSLGDASFVEGLNALGHSVQVLEHDHDELLGHAGALLRTSTGRIEAASDPRSDGAAAWVER